MLASDDMTTSDTNYRRGDKKLMRECVQSYPWIPNEIAHIVTSNILDVPVLANGLPREVLIDTGDS